MYENVSGIYTITNMINNKKYVGQSDNLERRFRHHKNELRGNRHHNQHMQRAWNKYGEENFSFDVVEKCFLDELDVREVYWISKLDSLKTGYNQNEGGGSNRGWIPSEETRQKMRENHADMSGENNPMYGKSSYDLMSDETKKNKIETLRKRMLESNPFKGRQHTAETKQIQSKIRKDWLEKNGNPMTGTKKSPEEIELMRKRMLGKFPRGNNPNAVKIVCLNTNEIFNCIQDAAEKYSIARTLISAVILGYKGHNSAGVLNGERLVWRKYEDFIKLSSDKIEKLIKYVQSPNSGGNSHNVIAVVCVNTGEMFPTATAAAKHYNIDNSGISKACKGNLSYYGFHPETGEKLYWKYLNDSLVKQ